MPRLTFHLIPNAHLDPVWLWDWREGLNEGLITIRTILDLMEQYKPLTFVRGEAAIYQHVEQTDPTTFRRIVKMVKQGRWDVVGGTLIQPDTNLPATETFARHLARGQSYFRSRFGRPVRVAWAADSFGHAAGMPEILAAAGIDSFAFTRPFPRDLPLAKAAFWWTGPGGSRVLAYRPLIGWYGSERDEMPARLSGYLDAASTGDLENVGCFFGLGNHGGGPTRRQIEEIRKWAEAHPQVKIIYSGLHRFFDALHKEAQRKGEDFLPVHRGELNFCLRGCFSSVAKFKFPYRRTEAALSSAERTDAILSAQLRRAAAELTAAWDAVLFNSFHDILPGSSIERAYEEQLAWLGSAFHEAQRVEFDALNALALQADTTVSKPRGDMPTAVAALVWNPHLRPFDGHIELEASLDYRPIKAYRGRPEQLPVRVLDHRRRPLPFQHVETEHTSMSNEPWRARVLVPLILPPAGWTVLEMGWIEDFGPPAAPGTPAEARDPGEIGNGIYRLVAEAGSAGVQIFHHGRPIFSGDGLQVAVYEDPWGSWGGMREEPEATHITKVHQHWTIANVQVLERGPERARLWVQFTGGSSRLELTFAVYRGREAVDVSARLMWNERSARLKLIMPAGEQAEYEVPGGRIKRGPAGQVPGGRWVRITDDDGTTFGFASDALYDFDTSEGALRATIVRATRYAADEPLGPGEQPWQPAVDAGELRFRFILTPGDQRLPVLAEDLEQPPVVLLVPPGKGKIGRSGTLAELKPDNLKLLALKRSEDGRDLVLRIQETALKRTRPVLRWLGQKMRLDVIGGGTIATWRLRRGRLGWSAKRVDTTER